MSYGASALLGILSHSRTSSGRDAVPPNAPEAYERLASESPVCTPVAPTFNALSYTSISPQGGAPLSPRPSQRGRRRGAATPGPCQSRAHELSALVTRYTPSFALPPPMPARSRHEGSEQPKLYICLQGERRPKSQSRRSDLRPENTRRAHWGVQHGSDSPHGNWSVSACRPAQACRGRRVGGWRPRPVRPGYRPW